jgi:hypothetical protein
MMMMVMMMAKLPEPQREGETPNYTRIRGKGKS